MGDASMWRLRMLIAVVTCQGIQFARMCMILTCVLLWCVYLEQLLRSGRIYRSSGRMAL